MEAGPASQRAIEILSVSSLTRVIAQDPRVLSQPTGVLGMRVGGGFRHRGRVGSKVGGGRTVAVVAPVLSILTPHYSEPDRGLYVRILRDAIDGDATVRNIALTGAYGSDKSGVLEPLEDISKGRVVMVSLSAAGAAESRVNPNSPAASSPTNRIVPQLEYLDWLVV